MTNDSSLNQLARMLQKSDRAAQIAQEWSNNMQPTYGTIIDIEDPEEQGRIKVTLDEMNPEILTEKGFDQGSAQATVTD